jgi:competence protein ComEC
VRAAVRLGPPGYHRGVIASATLLSEPEALAPARRMEAAAAAIRQGLRTASDGLSPDARGLLPGLVVGDTSNLVPSLATDMRTTNLTHLTAVSGANLALVAGFVLMIARTAGLRRTYLPLLAALAVAAFVVIARPEPSVLRAAVMSGVLLLAASLGIRSSGLPALAGAALLLMLIDPGQARSAGFALSVGATAGLLLFARPWGEHFAKVMPRPFAYALSIPLAAQAVCTPLLVILSGELSLIGVATNLLVTPAIAPATILGLIAGITALFWTSGAAVIAHIAGISVSWISWIARRGAEIPMASIPWPDGALGVLLSILVLIGLALAMRAAPRSTLLTAAGVIAIFSALTVVSPGWPPRDWAVVMCDVGQGDALVLRAGKSSGVVVDVGPEPRLVDTCLRQLGIKKVPLLVLTHMHADHVEGIPGVLRGRRIEQVWVSLSKDPPSQTARVNQWLTSIPTFAPKAGSVYQVGELTLEIIWPARVISEGSEANNTSLVLLATIRGMRLLLMGDVEPEAQANLVSEDLRPIHVLKVAHHGSAKQDHDLLERLAPKVAMISVGAKNSYGHPAPGILALLDQIGARTLRTDLHGALVVSGEVSPGGSTMRVASQRRWPWQAVARK